MKKGNRMKLRTLFFVLAVLLISAFLAFAGQKQDRGAKIIDLYGGKKGNIEFPHREHQETIEDCDMCHSVFPMEQNSIKGLKTQGELKKKKVMNTVCLKCHRNMKKAGKASGPVSCKKCHS